DRAAVSGIDGDAATELLDDAAAHGETEPGADAHGLRAEEWFEDALAQLGRDAGSGVADGRDDVVVFPAHRDADLVARRIAGADRLCSVDQHVDEHLLEPRGVRANRWDIGVVANEARAVPHVVA